MDVEKCTRDLRETVRELEAALATTRETVQQLKGALESGEDEIVGLRQMLTRTKKERDELRVQNAELINRLAVIGRKQSTSSSPRQSRSTPPPESPSTQSPVIQRRNSKIGSPLPALPPPPPADSSQPPVTDPVIAAATDEGSDTDYSDMEGDEATEKRTEGRVRRSKSPKSQTKGDPSSQQKFSRPKRIARSSPNTTTTAESSGTTAKLTSPKKSVAFQNLLSISEEEGGASPEQARMSASVQVTTEGKERIPPDSGAPVFGGVGGNEGAEETSQPRRRVTMSWSNIKIKRPSQELPSEVAPEIVTGGQPTVYDHLEMRRSRTSTISSSCGGSYKKEYKRKNSKQLKEAAAKLERSPDFISGGRKLHRLELFSPDMELRIREKICSEIGKKYCGLTCANKSAIVIQSAYRQYKLREQYNKIRKEASEVRQRAQSMKDPRRRPSMIRKKRPGRYNRNLSALAPSTDPLLKTKLLSQDIARAGVPHTHTSSRRQLVEKTRSVQSLSDGRQSAEPASSPTQETDDGAVEMEFAVCEIKLEDEATPTVCPDVAADGATTVESTDFLSLPTSFSTDVLLTSAGYTRPVSIFSAARPSSSIETTSLGQQRMSRGDDEDVTMSLSRRSLSPEVRDRKINMGIGHFNRKPTRGIQYLVRENVLPDSPQKVATFLASQYGLSKEKIGEFVGEISSEFHMAVLECLLEQMAMKIKPIDEALRDFQILFRMPGEAQKIDKIMQMFALEYFRFNKEGVIKSEDAAYILSFAIMMLHTSLHNPSVKSRTTKKQWVSMNRGCNDGENFPEQLLLEIYDRIGKREFTTGQDHTTVVSDIERNLIGYQNTSRLAIPQRRLICRAVVTEIDQLTSRPSFKNKRRRLVFVFSDQVIICKKRGGDQLDYRGSFSLMDAIAISFETHRKSLIFDNIRIMVQPLTKYILQIKDTYL
ncbi:IQ motif and SEC7 domain-containing protein 1 [Geodia barretti]|uniref:IQ motif and SEC7 domain-containing protein 1 n=1 Tax=Geodia barretti TaxID=519541 RepID=A0AA35RL92_GEOBA|nr:IQ motif and SEC7 domain-containing protein 1 [Geodia barretti]